MAWFKKSQENPQSPKETVETPDAGAFGAYIPNNYNDTEIASFFFDENRALLQKMLKLNILMILIQAALGFFLFMSLFLRTESYYYATAPNGEVRMLHVKEDPTEQKFEVPSILEGLSGTEDK